MMLLYAVIEVIRQAGHRIEAHHGTHTSISAEVEWTKPGSVIAVNYRNSDPEALAYELLNDLLIHQARRP